MRQRERLHGHPVKLPRWDADVRAAFPPGRCTRFAPQDTWRKSGTSGSSEGGETRLHNISDRFNSPEFCSLLPLNMGKRSTVRFRAHERKDSLRSICPMNSLYQTTSTITLYFSAA